MKKYIFLTLSLFIYSTFTAQVVIGSNKTAEKGVALKINSTDKGLLLPRIGLTSKNSYQPLKVAPPTGTLVFNTNIFGSFPDEIYKGLYWWDNENSTWFPFALNVKNYTIKYTNTNIAKDLYTAAYTEVPLLGKFQFSDFPDEFEKISESEIKFNSEGIYSITINLDLYTPTTPAVGIKVRILKNNLPIDDTTTRYITSQRTERYFFGNFTEYLEIKDGDILKIQAMKATNGSGPIRLNAAGTSSLTISRISGTPSKRIGLSRIK